MTGKHNTKAPELSTLTAQGGEEYGIDGAISGAVDSEEVAYVSGTETDKRVRLTVNILRMPVGTKLYATPPAPSSSAVEGLVADWNRQADYARGCSAQRKRDGKDHNWFDACADTFTVAANKLKEALASTAASGGDGSERPWRDMYRIERAMRFMDNGLSRADAFAAVDKELAAASAQGDGDGK